MTSLELLKGIEAWLSFNTEPSKEETAKLRKSIKEHVSEQLRIHDVSNRREQLIAFEANRHGVNWEGEYKDKRINDIDEYLKSN